MLSAPNSAPSSPVKANGNASGFVAGTGISEALRRRRQLQRHAMRARSEKRRASGQLRSHLRGSVKATNAPNAKIGMRANP